MRYLPMHKPRHGLWVADHPNLASSASFLDRVAELGISTLAAMLDSSEKPWDPRWSAGQWGLFCQRCIQRDIEVVATAWPYPSKKALDEMLSALRLYLPVGPAAIEIEAEGLWTERHVSEDFDGLDDASVYLMEGLFRLRDEFDVRLEVTTHPFHDEGHWAEEEVAEFTAKEERLEDLAPNFDRICWQGYSCNKTPSGDPVKWDSRLGPGHMQTFTFERALEVPGVDTGRPKLVAGLAAYRQKWDGHTPREAMRIAYQQALTFDPVEVRWWDSRFVVGAKANGYSQAFIRSL
jgi:hypothetical protein